MTDPFEPQAALLQITVWGSGAVLLFSVGGFVLGGGVPVGIGILTGGGVALLSVWWLGEVGLKLLHKHPTPWGRFIAITLLYGAVIGLLVLGMPTAHIDGPAFAGGLAVPLPVIVWKGLRLVFRMSR